MALVQKAFSDIITFSRSSNATRVGPDGLIQYAPHNLLLYSQELDNAAWTKGANVTVTANAAAAPDGTVTADLVVSSASADSSTNQVFQQVTVASSQTYTASFWVRAAGANQNITVRQTANGVLVTNTTVAVTSTWQRVSVTFTASTNPGFAIRPDTVSNLNIYVWGAQLAVGPLALDYTPTTTAAVYGPRFDYDGSGVTSVDPIATNLLLYSEQFDNAAWTKSNCTVTPNTTTAPDGTVTADKLVSANAATDGRAFQTLTLTVNTYSLSVYAKAAEFNWVALSYGGSDCWFNLSVGAVGQQDTGVVGTITSAGSGWYRCSMSFTGAAAAGTLRVYSTNADAVFSTGNGTSGIFIWGAQLELGSTATGYMPSGATNGFRAVPVVSGSATARGLLVEEQRTNLLTYSEMFADASWVKTSATVTANILAAPDGTVTGDLIESTGAGGRAVQTVSAPSTSVYTYSVYLKKKDTTTVELLCRNNTAGVNYAARFNLDTLATSNVSAGATASVVDVGNGWRRCTITTASITSGNSILCYVYGGVGTSGENVYAWGAQLEAGAFDTSYIPTVASTVTRSADVATINTLSPWYNATEGTLFVEVGGLQSGGRAITLSDGTSSNQILIAQSSSGVYASSWQAQFVSAYNSGKAALAFKQNSFAFSINGTLIGSDNSGNMANVDRLRFGGIVSDYPNGTIKKIAYYPRALSTAELQALTA